MDQNGAKKYTRNSASQSFTPDEVTFLNELFTQYQRGARIDGLMRTEAARGVQRKALGMKHTIERLRGERS